MNIKGRLKKIEAGHNLTGFCICYGRLPNYEVVFDPESEGKTKRLPDVCDRCGKRIDKSELTVTFDQHQETVNARRRQADETMKMFEG